MMFASSVRPLSSDSGVWLHRIDMTVRYNEARANSPFDSNHKLGTLLDYFQIPENTGISLENIIGWVVAKNMDALEICLVKSKKVLKKGLQDADKAVDLSGEAEAGLGEGPPHRGGS